MKIIGFAQLRNEAKDGFLYRFAESMRVCDTVYVYDQASTDDSHALYKDEDYKVIYGNSNEFFNEMKCKETLLRKILTDHPDADFILWMDGDTILDHRLWDRHTLEELCGNIGAADHIRFTHYNLWRSDTHYRVDNAFHWLSGIVAPIWKAKPFLSFGDEYGLHVRNQPMGLEKPSDCQYALIHHGFAHDQRLLQRFCSRFPIMQEAGVSSPWSEVRCIDESTMKVKRIPDNELKQILSPGHRFRDIDPNRLPRFMAVHQAVIEKTVGTSIVDIYSHLDDWMFKGD